MFHYNCYLRSKSSQTSLTPQKTNTFHRIYSRTVHSRHNLREEYGKRRSQTVHESGNTVGGASTHTVDDDDDELFEDNDRQTITRSGGGSGIDAGRDYDTEMTFTDLRAHLIPPTPPPRQHNARLGCLKLAMTTQSPKNTGSIDDSDGAGSIITTTTTTTTASMGRRGFGRSHTIDYDDDDDVEPEDVNDENDDGGTVADEAEDDYPFSNYVADPDDPFRLIDECDPAVRHGSTVKFIGDSAAFRQRRLERSTKSYLNDAGDFEHLEMAGCSSAPDERLAYQTTDMFGVRPDFVRRGPPISWPIIGHRHSSHYDTTASGNDDALTVTTTINQRASFHGRGQTSISRCIIVYECD